MTGSISIISFCLILMISPCQGQITKPSHGSREIAVQGKNFTIIWEISGPVPSIRHWGFKNASTSFDVAILLNDNEKLSSKTDKLDIEIKKPATLVLKNVDLRYNGTYTFTLTAAGNAYLSSVLVFVAVAPNVTLCSSSITVNESEPVMCLCTGQDGNPPANVTWYDKNDKQIGGVRKEENLLDIRNVTRTDNGTYKCVAESHPSAKDEKSVVVTVNFKPNVTSLTFSPNIVDIGDNVTIECKASGYPAPSYTIKLNDTLVLSNEMMYELTNLNASHGGSIITCIATNILGNDSRSERLPLKARPSVRINCSSTITVNESDSVRCLCAGKGGYPPANVTWYGKDGVMIGDVGKEGQMLTLNNVSETNNGTYKCVARSYNLQANESIKIIVQVKPKVTSLTFTPKVVYIGENVTIECKASGYPAPSYTITLNDKLVLSNQMMYELTNLDSSHRGSMITCTATNILGSDSQSKDLPLIVRPNVTINCSSTMSVNEGDSVRCLCEGEDGYPPANVTWYDKDGKMIGVAGDEEKMLTLNNVSKANNGTYKCVAQSYNLLDEESTNIIVHFKPTVTNLTFRPKAVHIGENVTIECKASGYPAPSYTITLNDKLVLSNEMMYELTNLNTSHIGAIITCTATNNLGNDSRSERLPLKDNTTKKNGSVGGISVGAIVGIVIGVLVLLVVVIVLARWKKNKEKDGHSRNVIVNSSNIDPANLYESVNDGSKAGGDNAGGSTSGSPPANANPSAVYASVDKNRKNEPSVTYATLDSLAMQTNASEKRDNEPKREPTEYASINFIGMKGGASVKKQ